MDEKLRDLMQNLAEAINLSLTDSDRIGEAIANIKAQGYDIFLVMEVTIGFNESGNQTNSSGTPMEAKPNQQPSMDIKWSTQDRKFLRSLRISRDES